MADTNIFMMIDSLQWPANASFLILFVETSKLLDDLQFVSALIAATAAMDFNANANFECDWIL